MTPTTLELGTRLRLERRRLGLAQADFGAKLGVSKTSQFNYEAGDRSPDALYLCMASQIGVDVQYVLTGQRYSGNTGFVQIPPHEESLPFLDGFHAGEGSDFEGISLSLKWLTDQGLELANLRVVEVIGDAMRPRLNGGDRVLVDISDRNPRGGSVYALKQSGEVLVKFCQLLPQGILRVSNANSDYPAYDAHLDETEGVSIIGRVRASMHAW